MDDKKDTIDLGECITIDLTGVHAAQHDYFDSNMSSITIGPDVFTVAGTNVQGPAWTASTWTQNDWTMSDTIRPNNKLSIQGQDADIEINGVSLMQTLQGIQDRLNILRPNAELEQQWDQLRELGDRYRALESELKEKMQAWNALKS